MSGLCYSDLLLDLPKQTKELITNLQQGKLEVQIPQLDVLLQKLDRVSNQISFSIVLLSFSIVLTGLMGSRETGNCSLVYSCPSRIGSPNNYHLTINHILGIGFSHISKSIEKSIESG